MLSLTFVTKRVKEADMKRRYPGCQQTSNVHLDHLKTNSESRHGPEESCALQGQVESEPSALSHSLLEESRESTALE